MNSFRCKITTLYLGGGWGELEVGEFPVTGWGVGVGGEWVDCASAACAALASHYLQWEARAPAA